MDTRPGRPNFRFGPKAEIQTETQYSALAPRNRRKQTMTIDVRTRHAVHYSQSERMTSADLRENFVIENLFVAGTLQAVYTHYDRMLVAGVTPTQDLVSVGSELAKLVGADYLLERRELGLINIGGSGRVIADGRAYALGPMDGL